MTMPPKINPTAYTPLLDTIAKGESNGNYDAYFGNASNKDFKFTDMTVNDVLKWQSEHVKNGSVSSAVGRYQIIRPTLAGLVKELGINGNEKFTPRLQDKLAIKLLERRGAIEFVQEKITREQFAANLAKEWAALPSMRGPNPNNSYYAADGINKARVTVSEIETSLVKVAARVANI